MTNFLLIFGNEFEKICLQVSTFANEPWKGNFLGIHFCQIDQSSRNLGKQIPKRFAFYRIDIFKVLLTLQFFDFLFSLYYDFKLWTLSRNFIEELFFSRIIEKTRF